MTTEQQAPPTDVQRCEELLREIVSIRSVVGEDTTAHLWLSARLREAGMTVEHYAVEGRRTPLVLGIFEGQGPNRASFSMRTTTRSGPSRATGRAIHGRPTSRMACSTGAARSTARVRWWRC